MCQHNDFDVLYYKNGILIRKCKHCGEIEAKFEHWQSIEEVRTCLEAMTNV